MRILLNYSIDFFIRNIRSVFKSEIFVRRELSSSAQSFVLSIFNCKYIQHHNSCLATIGLILDNYLAFERRRRRH